MSRQQEGVPVLVENNSGLHAVVYAYTGSRIRLGQVKPWSQEILWIPRAAANAQSMQLFTRQIGGDTFLSEAVPLGHGLLVFRIQGNLRESYLLLR